MLKQVNDNGVSVFTHEYAKQATRLNARAIPTPIQSKLRVWLSRDSLDVLSRLLAASQLRKGRIRKAYGQRAIHVL